MYREVCKVHTYMCALICGTMVRGICLQSHEHLWGVFFLFYLIGFYSWKRSQNCLSHVWLLVFNCLPIFFFKSFVHAIEKKIILMLLLNEKRFFPFLSK